MGQGEREKEEEWDCGIWGGFCFISSTYFLSTQFDRGYYVGKEMGGREVEECP